MAIVLTPPADQTPFRQFSLESGTCVRPDFAKGGRVTVESESDATELEREGWVRMPALAKARADDGPFPLAKAQAVLEELRNLEARLRKVEGGVRRERERSEMRQAPKFYLVHDKPAKE